MPASQNQFDENSALDFTRLAQQIKHWGNALGFQQVGIGTTQVDEHEVHLMNWLKAGRHGEMSYMSRHGVKRSRPSSLVPGTLRIISVRMDYFPSSHSQEAEALLQQDSQAYIARYALGRDYHKLMRKRLQGLADMIAQQVGNFNYRAFVDSAPVLEKALAQQAGLGWIGKHTNLINESAGSWFFLGELYTDLPLPTDLAAHNHCGSCEACITACPTQAIVAPYQLDARRCISYLTIELRDSIPEELRPMMGNRIFGCDDCQLVCPWNRFAHMTVEEDFLPRHGLDTPQLMELFLWSEAQFLQQTAGSAIRRIGYPCWLRNIAVALGNAPTTPAVVSALGSRKDHPSPLVREHVAWALARHEKISIEGEARVTSDK